MLDYPSTILNTEVTGHLVEAAIANSVDEELLVKPILLSITEEYIKYRYL